MIIKEDKDNIICIEQHEHALISGQFVHKWNEGLFPGLHLKSSVEYAITNHDRSWIPLDRKLVYLKEKGSMASFIDYPLKKKIEAYRRGIEQLLTEDIYAAYLISCHYASFFKGKKDILGKQFMASEEARQEQLLEKMILQDPKLSKEMLNFHFELLQLCDNLSLYLCMNRWGAKKQEEVEWFRDGFSQQLAPVSNEVFQANWESETQVRLSPFPFKTETLHVSIPYKVLSKQDLHRKDLQEIYRKIPYDYHAVIIRN
ncbi:hypothetical protein CR194_06915 [Salipaludibacillus keqinensis]|uniref:Uncharacterized protein n=1 Tax=Salipaludibacillus keqinensis TaxID=2045207 RepID=A0A323TKA7_9BACI|nr:DUF3891 family protein [Salipaludibacillus keqinensis]PYZ95239.1 hypothetical protein CR194_06915 [Salipaludibacillus keqinensis]